MELSTSKNGVSKKKEKPKSIMLYQKLQDTSRLFQVATCLTPCLAVGSSIRLLYQMDQMDTYFGPAILCSILSVCVYAAHLTSIAKLVDSLEYNVQTGQIKLTTYHGLWGKRVITGHADNLSVLPKPKKVRRLPTFTGRLFSEGPHELLKHKKYVSPFRMLSEKKGEIKNRKVWAHLGISLHNIEVSEKSAKQSERAQPQPSFFGRSKLRK